MIELAHGRRGEKIVKQLAGCKSGRISRHAELDDYTAPPVGWDKETEAWLMTI